MRGARASRARRAGRWTGRSTASPTKSIRRSSPRSPTTLKDRTVTIGSALASATRLLGEAGSDSPRLDAVRLLEATLGREAGWMLAHDADALEPRDGERFEALLSRRAAGEPVAYVTGVAGFYGRRFEVTPDVLVPRPETEELAERAIAFVRASTAGELLMCDVGTGSGALAVTFAAEVRRVRCIATDISKSALAVAAANAEKLGVADRVRFLPSDLLDRISPETRFACVVANLPYVETRAIAPAPAPVSFEPRLALDGGPDGLDLYRRLFPQLEEHLEPGAAVLLEAGAGNAPALGTLARARFPAAEVSVHRDYAGRPRIVELCFP